ncbi:MAG: rhomboid family intramembrane serine protease [Planctomycetota bacterium]
MTSSYRDSYQDGGSGAQGGATMPRMTPMVKLLLIANAVTFAAQFLLGFTGARGMEIQVAGLAPQVWADFFPFVPFWQVVTYGFLHSTNDPMHLLWNLLLLYFFGTMLEAIVGSRRFLATYVGALLAGASLHLAAEFLGGSRHPAIGASGAVLGVLIAVAVLRPNTQVIVLFIPIALKWLAVGIVGIDVFFVLKGFQGMSDGTAHYVHVGGAAFGFLAARRGWIWKDPIQTLRNRRSKIAAHQVELRGKHLDDLLAKIHREGLGSLSQREKDFLKRMSGRDRS